MALVKHDILKNKEGLTALTLAGDLGEEERQALGEGYEIIHSFDAGSYFEAMTMYCEFMGWGCYDTPFEIDKKPYDIVKLSARIHSQPR